MTKYLSPGVVRQIVNEAGTEFATVEFDKVSGDPCRINGAFRVVRHTVGGVKGEAARARNQANGLVPIWSTGIGRKAEDGKAAWRSFKLDRVRSITTKGRTYRAD